MGPGRYDALIQLAGGRPGVRLHGMTSLANAASALADEQRAVARALERGRQEAQWVARSIGRRRVKLQQIDRRGAARPLMQARAMGFDPSEAPKPRASVHLQLTYCLSDCQSDGLVFGLNVQNDARVKFTSIVLMSCRFLSPVR